MKAAVITPSGFDFAEIEAPRLGSDDVLVRVRAAALNHADLGVLAGRMHGTTGGRGTVLGMEWAGEVLATGPAVRGLRAGDRVMAMGRGALAEQAITDSGRVLPLPRAHMDWQQAAALPIALQTMHDAIVTRGRLRTGETVLIQGASSAVGLLGLKLARWLGAALVIGTSRRAFARDRLLDFGAHLALDSGAANWPQQVLDATCGRGVDLVIDMLAGPAMNGNLAAAAIGARIINVGRLAGRLGEFDFDLHALRRIEYIGVTFRTRTAAEVTELVRRMRADLWPPLEAGELSVPVAATYAFRDLAEAFAELRRGGHLGKLVVTLP